VSNSPSLYRSTQLSRSRVGLCYYRRSPRTSVKAIDLGKESQQTPQERAEKTMLAIKEFKHYLENVEKDLSRMSKKFSIKEIAQSIGFAATGIQRKLETWPS